MAPGGRKFGRPGPLVDAYCRRPWLAGTANGAVLRAPLLALVGREATRLPSRTEAPLDALWLVNGARDSRHARRAALSHALTFVAPGGLLLTADLRDGPALSVLRDAGGDARPAQAMPISEATTAQALYRYFGHAAFRDGQSALLGRTLARQSCLGILPTGAGKSVCFLLPALLDRGVAIVVTPLKALGRDHEMGLEQVGLSCARRIDSSLCLDKRRKVIGKLERGALKLLFVTPERFLNATFVGLVREMQERVPVSAWVVDEAHCVSEWGHDFRPAYLGLERRFRELNPDAPITALTATASQRVQADVLELLGLKGGAVVPRTLDRQELSFSVEAHGPEPIAKFRSALAAAHERVPEAGQSIIYTPLTGAAALKSTDPEGKALEGAEWLANKLKAVAYHGSVANGEQIHRAFKRGEIPVLVSTKAFGMGIDIPSVRVVAHTGIAQSQEQYYQEGGRAGRDGRRAHCLLVYVPRPKACQQQYPASGAERRGTLPPCAANPWFKCVSPFREGLNKQEQRLCSYGLQVHLLARGRRGPVLDLLLLAGLAQAVLAQAPPGGSPHCVFIELARLDRTVVASAMQVRGEDAYAALGRWLTQRREGLQKRAPAGARLLGELGARMGFGFLEDRWRQEANGKDLGVALRIEDLEATRLMVALRRLGAITDFAPRFDVVKKHTAATANDAEFRLRGFEVQPAPRGASWDRTALVRIGLHAYDAPHQDEVEVVDEILRLVDPDLPSDAKDRKQLGLLLAVLLVAHGYREYLPSRLEMLGSVEAYASSNTCRKQQILGYFGEVFPYAGPCCRCDVCGFEGEPVERADVHAVGLLGAELDRLAAAEAPTAELVHVVDQLVLLRAAAETQARLMRALEETPDRTVLRVARVLVEARLSHARGQELLREQNRLDFDAAIEDTERRLRGSSAGTLTPWLEGLTVLLRERSRWHPTFDEAWRRRRADALSRLGDRAAATILQGLASSECATDRVPAAALWVEGLWHGIRSFEKERAHA